MTEHQQQCTVVHLFRYQYPAYDGCLLAIPNGTHIAGNSTARAIKVRKLKKEGMKTGTSDLLLAVPTTKYHGLWLEMKDIGKKEKDVSGDQMDHILLMRRAGYRAEWAAGADEAIAIIKDYMKEALPLDD
jgi:hypothetical protein